ncbi:MAG: glycogen synthase GlgA [Hyphomicrobiales bacterium]|nr:MAG: glycogen synthase GlgA [Hyphomicrobiales bacterium]
MKVLYVASECAPFVKTGGLADVIGAVPKNLSQFGVDTRVIMPAYPALAGLLARGKIVWQQDDLFGGPANLVAVKSKGIALLLLNAPHLYDRPGNIYLNEQGQDWPDNHLRFGALCQVAAYVASYGLPRELKNPLNDWQPDLVHCHDWQSGLVPAYLKMADTKTPPCILTIHNIAFQGLFDAKVIKTLGLSQSMFVPDGFEYWGKVSFLKAAIAYCHKITTVSPTYAHELMLPEFGMGLEGMMQSRASDLSGILNGIDTDVWDPIHDRALNASYYPRTLKRKAKNRAQVEARFDLDPIKNPDAPLFCVISRLTTQKGLDLLVEALPNLVARGARLALLGSGDKDIEAAFIAAARQFKGRVGTIIGYDEELSHILQGGADAILVPSRFEPCGLTQLYGLRYGTIPVVARTGGLADTIIDANPAALADNCATGFQFAPITAISLGHAIDRACQTFKQPQVWEAMMRRAMNHDVSWDKSAKAYHDLYASLLI